MMGDFKDEQQKGIIPRASAHLLTKIATDQVNVQSISVNCTYIELYNEQIYDLIDHTNQNALKMRWNKYQQFIVEDLFEPQCRNVTEAIQWWKKGQKNKIMDSHQMNNQSSRSHCILTMKVKSYEI